MRFRPDKKYIIWGVTAFLVAACSILFIFAVFNYPIFALGFSNFLKVMMPVINGFLIAYLLNPTMMFFERKVIPAVLRILNIKEPETFENKRIMRYISIGLSVVFVLLVIVAFISIVIPQLIGSIKSIAQQFPEYVENFTDFMNKTFDDNPQVLEYYDQYYSQLEEWTRGLMTNIPSYINKIWDSLSKGILNSISFVYNIVLGFILSIYILSFKEKFIAQIRKIILAYFSRKRANGIFMEIKDIDRIFRDYITSSIVDSFIIGVLCFIACLILRTPYAILMSFIVGITNIIPFFGPFIGGIPCAVILLMIDPIQAMYFIIMVVILQQLDGNVIKPKLFGDSTGLPAFWVVVSILLGGGFFGVMGMYLGTPVFAVIYSFIRRAVASKLTKKGLPSETSRYLRSNELPYEAPKDKKPKEDAADAEKESETTIAEELIPEDPNDPQTQTSQQTPGSD